MSYTVVGTRQSRTFRVLWLMEEMGLEYEHLPALPRSDDVRAHNLIGKVPVLIDHDAGMKLTDSVAIMTYLADKHGKLTHPAGTPERAQQDSLTHLILDEFDGLLWTGALHTFVLPEELRVPEVKDSLRWSFVRHLTHLGVRYEEPFLMGSKLLLPDILAGHCLSWAKRAKFDIVDPRLEKYLQMLQARPAYEKVVELP